MDVANVQSGHCEKPALVGRRRDELIALLDNNTHTLDGYAADRRARRQKSATGRDGTDRVRDPAADVTLEPQAEIESMRPAATNKRFIAELLTSANRRDGARARRVASRQTTATM